MTANASVPPLRPIPRPLHGLRSARVQTFRGPIGPIWDLAVFADGSRAVLGGDAPVREVDLATGAITARYAVGRDASYRVAVTPDGSRVLATTIKGGLFCFDAATAALCWKAKAHPKQCEVALTRDGRVLTANMGNVRVFDLATGALLAKFAVKKAAFSLYGFHPTADGRVATWYADEAKALDLATGKFAQTIASPPAPGEIDTLSAISADGRSLARLSTTGALRLTDLASGQTVHVPGDPGTRDAATAWFRALAALPGTADGFVASSADGRLTVYRDGACAGIVEFDGNLDGPFALFPDGERALVVERGSLHVLDLRLVVPRRAPLERHPSDIVREAAPTPDGSRWITSSRDRHLRIWSLDPVAQVGAVRTPEYDLHWVVHPDGRRVLYGGVHQTLWVLDLETGETLHALAGHTGTIERVAASRDGAHAYTLGADGDVRIWSLATGECLAVLPVSEPNRYPSVVFDSRRDVLLTVRGDELTAVALGPSAQTSRTLAGRCAQLLLSEQGSHVCRVDGIRAGGGRVSLYDAASETLLARLDVRGDGPFVVALGPRGEWVLIASGDPRTLLLWWPADGRTAPVPGDAYWTVAAPSSDGRLFALATSEPRLTVWDARAGTLVAALDLERPASCLSMTRAGHVLAVDTGGNVQAYEFG